MKARTATEKVVEAEVTDTDVHEDIEATDTTVSNEWLYEHEQGGNAEEEAQEVRRFTCLGQEEKDRMY
ncbi:hypothetical protein LIER_30221 [Lithospermum erythrorhizon]|uniref:Uncharacterized protein n=1 Tax=Lithospermum erythrorhizon TaxID=34254 RepID=A0AAV3RNL8_LITER